MVGRKETGKTSPDASGQNGPRREKVPRQTGLLTIIAIVIGILLGACLLDRGPVPPSGLTSATPIPTFTPTPRLIDSVIPSPTPVTNLSRSRAEFLVWNEINACANEVARSTQIGIEVAFSSSFDAGSGVWLIQATIGALELNLGLWEVADETGSVEPTGEVASAIASRQYVCIQPEALLSEGLTPPSFATPTPTPIPTSTPLPTPEPTATPVPTLTLIPSEIPTPTQTPVVATGTQAELRVWLAVRDCFLPPPAAESFTGYQDRSDRWIVEGRMEPDQDNRQQDDRQTGDATTFYGLWLVDSNSGEVIPHDNLAKRIKDNRFCYVEP